VNLFHGWTILLIAHLVGQAGLTLYKYIYTHT